jgi:hypothetical protein
MRKESKFHAAVEIRIEGNKFLPRKNESKMKKNVGQCRGGEISF